MSKWLGGDRFTKVRRGARGARAGGVHSKPHTKKQLRAFNSIRRSLSELFAVVKKSNNVYTVSKGVFINTLKGQGWERMN